MYTRELKEAPEYPVFNREPNFGSYTGNFKFFDISGMKRPYGGFPIPAAVTKLRIFGFSRFMFCTEEFIGETFFFSNPFFAYMETIVWDRETGSRHIYRKAIFDRLTRIPRKVEGGVTACRTKRKFARISIREGIKNVALELDFSGSRSKRKQDKKPAFQAKITLSSAAAGGSVFSTLIPYVTRRRCQASFFAVGYSGGEIIWRGKPRRIQGAALFEMKKAYFSLRTKTSGVYGFSLHEGRILAFHIGDSVSKDDFNCNNNVLFYDGKITPLPPVRITRPYGSSGEWIIQDTENMVDLKFLPVSVHANKKSLFVVRTQYKTIYGNYEGVLKTADGEDLVLKDFPGIAKKILLRM